MIEYDDIAGHVAIILRTTKKWKLKNLVSGSIAQKDAVIEEISQNVSRSVRGTFELRRKDWREGLRASDWRPGEDGSA